MARRRQKPRANADANGRITRRQAEQAVKITAVMLRDHSPMSFQEAVSAFVYCWNRTESIEQSEERERREGGNAT